jgi:acetyl esterase/lipase
MGARRRIWRRAAAFAAVLAAAGGAGVGGVTDAGVAAQPAGAQAAGPTLTLDPAAGLADGAEVTVTATGVGDGEFLMLSQCAAGVTDPFDGDCAAADYAYGAATDGTATFTMRVDAVLDTGIFDATSVDCRPAGACVLALLDEDGGALATAPLAFAPGAPLAPPPTVSLSPAAGLADLQVVTLAGSGLVWSDAAFGAQCAADPASIDDCDWETQFDVAVDGGVVSADYTASAVISTESRGTVDCRVPGSCVVAITQNYLASPAKSATAPIGFDPATEVVEPTLTLDPASGLADGDSVTVTGAGFRPGSFVSASLCGAERSWETCQGTPSYGEVAADGTVTVDVTVWAVVELADGTEVDCRASTGACTVVVGAGSVGSPRSGVAPLAFDPDAPLKPTPTITVEPATGLADDATVTVTGSNFTPGGFVSVELCSAADQYTCDQNTVDYAFAATDGTFTLDLAVASVIAPWEGGPVDCRTAGCEVVARDEERGRTATAALSFAPEAPPVDRYLDPVFDDVTVTEDVVFREVADSTGHTVQLTADIYEPAGDTETTRPAVVWLEGGWFDGGPGEDMSAYARAFAQRGYVAVTMQHRDRPGLACCPTRDALGITAALVDAHDDATHGVAWLREHADEYGIDPDAVAAGGAQAGAVAAYGLAFRPDGSHHQGPADVAAALPIAGTSLGRPTHEGAPVLAFHGADDLLAPLHLSDWTCADAEEEGVVCDTVSYAGGGNEIALTRQRDIVRRSAEFLATNVLAPLGYIDEPVDPTEPPTHPTDPPTHPTRPTTPPGRGGAGGHGQPGGSGGSGSLAKTGSETVPLFQLGCALAATGAVLVMATRRRRGLALLPVPARLRRRRPGDGGGTTLPAVVVVAVAGLVIALVAAPGYTLARQEGTDTTSTTSATSASSTTTVTVTPGDASVTTSTMPMEGPETTDTTVASPITTAPSSATTMPDMGHDGPGPHDPDPPTDPGEFDFPDEWTPEQVAFATQLIRDTEAALPRFANQAILGLLGYTWIFDGVTDDTYQHWINTSLILNQGTLDPEQPESLVFRQTPDGPVLEAAMYMLPTGYDLTNIPEDIAWLPDWHVHRNLCFDSNFRIVGLTVDGVCEVGFNFVTPPMLHVWAVDTPCGRFAGVDENGLQCHDEHDG